MTSMIASYRRKAEHFGAEAADAMLCHDTTPRSDETAARSYAAKAYRAAVLAAFWAAAVIPALDAQRERRRTR